MTLVRTHGETAVAAFFNLSASAGSFLLPAGDGWNEVLHAGTRDADRRNVSRSTRRGASGSFAQGPRRWHKGAREGLARSPHPLGATWDGEGVNFALFSEHAHGGAAALFEDAAIGRPWPP